MAMTKAEKAAVEAALQALDAAREETQVAKALSWPSYSQPATIPPPDHGHTTGWHAIPARAKDYHMLGLVEFGWSESVAHGSGPHKPHGSGRSASQRGVALFASEADALRAVRLEITLEAAKKLRRIDQMIEAAEAKADAR